VSLTEFEVMSKANSMISLTKIALEALRCCRLLEPGHMGRQTGATLARLLQCSSHACALDAHRVIAYTIEHIFARLPGFLY